MIRHIVILYFQKNPQKDFLGLLEKTKPIVNQIPGVLKFEIFPNINKYVPSHLSSFCFEIIFANKRALENFMIDPRHDEAEAIFEEYLADPPYVFLTHEMTV